MVKLLYVLFVVANLVGGETVEQFLRDKKNKLPGLNKSLKLARKHIGLLSSKPASESFFLP